MYAKERSSTSIVLRNNQVAAWVYPDWPTLWYSMEWALGSKTHPELGHGILVCDPQHHDSDWQGLAPESVELKAQAGLACTKLVWAVACGIRNLTDLVYSDTIRYNEELVTKMVARGRQWWERYVLGGDEPPLDIARGDYESMIELYATLHRSRTWVAMTEEQTEIARALFADLKRATQESERAQLKLKLARGKISRFMKRATAAVGTDGVVYRTPFHVYLTRDGRYVRFRKYHTSEKTRR
jgi:ketosteroid isomerase-like protein